MNATGSRVRQREFTFGMYFRLVEHLKVQANDILRRSDDPALPDYDNDILLVNVQLGF